jgi:hypothetical protein
MQEADTSPVHPWLKGPVSKTETSHPRKLGDPPFASQAKWRAGSALQGVAAQFCATLVPRNSPIRLFTG